MFDFRGAVEPTLFFWPCNTTDMSDARGVFSYADVDGHSAGITTISNDTGKPVYYNSGTVNVNKSSKEISLVGAGFSFSKMKPYSTLYITFGHADPGTSYTWYEVTYISPTKVQAVGTLPSDYSGVSYCLRADWGSCFSLRVSLPDSVEVNEEYCRTITLNNASNFTIGMWVKFETNMKAIPLNGEVVARAKIKIGDYFLSIVGRVSRHRSVSAFVNNETTVRVSLPLSTWIFMGAVFNNGKIKFYVNSMELSGGSSAPVNVPEISINNRMYFPTGKSIGFWYYIKQYIDSIKYKEGGNFISEMYGGGASAEEF